MIAVHEVLTDAELAEMHKLSEKIRDLCVEASPRLGTSLVLTAMVLETVGGARHVLGLKVWRSGLQRMMNTAMDAIDRGDGVAVAATTARAS